LGSIPAAPDKLLKKEGDGSVTKCDKLKLQSTDGKFYKTDVANVETLLRLIQSIPSKKTEPIKLWLAKIGRFISTTPITVSDNGIT
jgi:hypothetical protein